MKKHELIPNISLTKHPLVRHLYANKFSLIEWNILSKIRLSDFCEKGFDDRLVLKVFDEIHEVVNYEHVKQHFAKGRHNFQEVVDYIVNKNTNKNFLKQEEATIDEEQLLTGMLYLDFKGFNPKILNGIMEIIDINERSVLDCIITIASLCKSNFTIDEKQKLLLNYWRTLAYSIIFRDFTQQDLLILIKAPSNKLCIPKSIFSISIIDNYGGYLDPKPTKLSNSSIFNMEVHEKYKVIKKCYLKLKIFFQESKKLIESMEIERLLIIEKQQPMMDKQQLHLVEESQVPANDQPEENSSVLNLSGFWSKSYKAISTFTTGLSRVLICNVSELDTENETPFVCFF